MISHMSVRSERVALRTPTDTGQCHMLTEITALAQHWASVWRAPRAHLALQTQNHSTSSRSDITMKSETYRNSSCQRWIESLFITSVF